MKKRGQISTGAIIVIVIITVLVITGVFAPKISNTIKLFFILFGINEEKTEEEIYNPTTLSPAELAFESFLTSYKDCKKHKKGDCLCDEFDITQIPFSYSIKLENIDGSTRVGLYSNEPTPEKVELIDNDNLCLYGYISENKFSVENTQDIDLSPRSSKPYKIGNKIQLFRLNERATCFVSDTSESKKFDEITKLKLKCDLKDEEIKAARVGILDLSDYIEDYPYESFVKSEDSEASKIIEHLRTFLSNNVGSVTRITELISSKQERLQRRENMFNDAYNNFDKDKDGLINDDVYFISIRVLQLKKEDSQIKKDYFKVHYLQGSVEGEILAKKIKSKLEELNGKLIFNDKEVEKAKADEKYRFGFEFIVEENSKDSIGPVFLTCTQSYSDFIACKESTLIPAVFVDIVEVYGDGYYIFEGHQRSIAQKIYEGVKDYITEKENI